jgi:YVTN family beta-propeller protein
MAYVTNDARGTVSVLTTAIDAVPATPPVAGPARVAIT